MPETFDFNQGPWPDPSYGQPQRGQVPADGPYSPSKWSRVHLHEAAKERRVVQANYFARVLIFIMEVVVPYSLTSDIGEFAPNLSFFLFFGWLTFNNVYLQGKTGGQSLGKKLFNYRLTYVVVNPLSEVSDFYCQPSYLRCAVREAAHFLDLLFFIGLWLPIVNVNGRTLADVIAQTSVIRNDPSTVVMTAAEARDEIAARSGWNR